MTQDAQAALRRIMEQNARITRFCLVCNYVTRSVSFLTSLDLLSHNLPPGLFRIIDPLASRCSKFRFKPLDPGSTSVRLAQIASAENVPVNQDTINALISTSHGDLRRAITYLQSASRLAMSTTPPSEITPRDVQEIAGVVPDDVINDFAEALGIEKLGGSSMDMDVDDTGRARAKGFDGVRKKVKEIIREGYSASQVIAQVNLFFVTPHIVLTILLQLHDYTVAHPTLSARQKAQCALAFAEADKALCDGADEELWILEVGLRVHKAMAGVS